MAAYLAGKFYRHSWDVLGKPSTRLSRPARIFLYTTNIGKSDNDLDIMSDCFENTPTVTADPRKLKTDVIDDFPKGFWVDVDFGWLAICFGP